MAFRDETPVSFYACLTEQQWLMVVSALKEKGTEEAVGLAEDILAYILPPG